MIHDLNALDLAPLYAELSKSGLVRRLIELARDEDLGPPPGLDATSASIRHKTRSADALLNARKACTVAGLAAVPDVLAVYAEALSAPLAFRPLRADGDTVPANTTLGVITGPRAAVLAAERVVLNLISRLSGVATLTRAYADRIRAEAPGSPARLYDTRKTTPGLRVLEKYAVRCGGGRSHRLGLYDAALLKDNHLAGVPTSELPALVAAAAQSARAAAHTSLRFVQVEADTLDQLDALLTLPGGVIDIVLLDNMTPEQMQAAVAKRDRANPALELEASGNVRLETIGAIARTGVDRISAGALTHQATSVDIGLDIP